MGAKKLTATQPSRSFIEAVKHKFGSVVPDWVWFHENLRPADIKLYKVLMDFAEETVKKYSNKYMLDEFYPGVLKSQKTIADRAGCSAKSVRSGLERLEDIGLITLEERGVKETNIVYMMGEPFGIVAENKGLTNEEKKEVQDINDIRMRRECGMGPEVDLKLFRKWRELGGMSRNEEEVVAIAEHYSSLVRKRLGKSGYRVISKTKPSEHKYFPKFEALRDLAQDKGWDAKQYLEFIFAWTEAYWGRDSRSGKKRHPYPNQIMSEKLLNHFEKELIRQDERYRLSETNQKIVAPVTRSFNQDIELAVKQSAEAVGYYVERYRERVKTGVEPKNKVVSEPLFKALYIYDNWMMLNPEYLYTVGWFRDAYAKDLQEADPTDPSVEKLVETFNMLSKSKRFNNTALTSAIKYENRSSVPRNLTMEELGVKSG